MGVVLLSFLLAYLAPNFNEITALSPQEETLQTDLHLNLETRLPLAYTVRVDPLDKFSKYRGGYMITNKHYWSSTIFTGVYGYAFAAIWLLAGLIYAGFLLSNTYYTRNKRKPTLPPPCSKLSSSGLLFLGIFFTVLIIIVSVIVLVTNTKFHSRAKMIKTIVVEAVDGAATTIHNVTRAMQAMQEYVQSDSEASNQLNSTSERLVAEGSYIQQRAHKKQHLIDKGLKILFSTTAISVALNLILVLVLLGCGLLRLTRAFYLIFFICWLLTALCWMYFGVYFFIDKFTGDACLALEEYRDDPHNSSLSTILPCDNLLSAKHTLLDTRSALHDLISQVNANISMLQATSSFHGLRLVCNPFSAPPEYTYQPENCTKNTIRIGDILQVSFKLPSPSSNTVVNVTNHILKRLSNFDFSWFFEENSCSGSNAGTCSRGRYISTETFNTMQAYTSSIQNLLDAIPGMESLVNCKLVKDTITNILSKQCGPIKKLIHTLWSVMAILSTAMVALTLTWIRKAYQDEKYSLSSGSIKPHSVRDNTSPSIPIQCGTTGKGIRSPGITT